MDNKVCTTLALFYSIHSPIGRVPYLQCSYTYILPFYYFSLLQMFCYQCEQTKNGVGCTSIGVCGKTPEVTVLQDLLTYSLKGLSCWAHFAVQKGVELPVDLASFLHSATFSTLTNVNFDAARF